MYLAHHSRRSVLLKLCIAADPANIIGVFANLHWIRLYDILLHTLQELTSPLPNVVIHQLVAFGKHRLEKVETSVRAKYLWG